VVEPRGKYYSRVMRALVTRLDDFFCRDSGSKLRLWFCVGLYALLTVFWGIPVALLQLMISFVFPIRFCVFPTRYFGHFLYELDKTISRPKNLPGVTIYTNQPKIVNKIIFSAAKKKLKFAPRILVIPIVIANKILKTRKILKPEEFDSYMNSLELRELQKLPSWFIFSQGQISQLERMMKKFLPNEGPIITLHLRLAEYGNTEFSNSVNNEGHYRDVISSSYTGLIDNLNSEFNVIDISNSVIYQIHTRAKVYYSNLTREDHELFSLYLTYRSTLCITTDSGSLLAAILFRKKVFQTNLSLFGLVRGPSHTVAVLKSAQRIVDGSALSLTTLILTGAENFSSSSQFRSEDIALIDNSPDLLAELCSEISDVAHGNWVPSSLNTRIIDALRKIEGLNIPEDTFFSNVWCKESEFFLRGVGN